MTKPFLKGDRVRLSPTAIKQGIHSTKDPEGKRLGTVVSINRSHQNLVNVLWDGNKTAQSIYDGYIMVDLNG